MEFAGAEDMDGSEPAGIYGEGAACLLRQAMDRQERSSTISAAMISQIGQVEMSLKF